MFSIRHTYTNRHSQVANSLHGCHSLDSWDLDVGQLDGSRQYDAVCPVPLQNHPTTCAKRTAAAACISALLTSVAWAETTAACFLVKELYSERAEPVGARDVLVEYGVRGRMRARVHARLRGPGRLGSAQSSDRESNLVARQWEPSLDLSRTPS